MPHCGDCECVLSESYERRWGNRRTNDDGELICAECAGVYDGAELATDGGQSASDTGRMTCINDGCDKPRERVVTMYGGVAPVCQKHAEERLEHPHVVDQTGFFKGERDEPKPEPSPNDPLPPKYRRSRDTNADHGQIDPRTTGLLVLVIGFLTAILTAGVIWL